MFSMGAARLDCLIVMFPGVLRRPRTRCYLTETSLQPGDFLLQV